MHLGPRLPVLEGVHGDVPLLAERGPGQPELDRLVVAVEQDQEGVIGDRVAFAVWLGDGLASAWAPNQQERASRSAGVAVPAGSPVAAAQAM
jgi:hypothetical protein